MFVSAPCGFTCRIRTPAARQKASSAPSWYSVSVRISSGVPVIWRRPKPTRSGNPGCAPTAEAFAEIAVQIDGRHRRTPCGDMAPIAHRHHRTTRRKPCRLVILARELTYRDPRDPTNTRSAHGRGDDASDDRLHFPAHETPTSA